MSADRRYSDAEVEAIFRRALERQVDDDGLEHEDLIAAAREMGLDPEALERASREVAAEREEADVRDAVITAKRAAWGRHLSTYVIVVGGLVGAHVLGLIGPWVAWVALGWGIALAFDTLSAVRAPSERRLGKERRRRRKRRQKRARVEARARHIAERELARQARAEARARGRGAEDELERVIEEGVTMLIRAAVRQVERATEKLEARERAAPASDFQRYVAGREGKKVDATPAAPSAVGPKVRVDAEGSASTEEELEVTDERAKAGRVRRGNL